MCLEEELETSIFSNFAHIYGKQEIYFNKFTTCRKSSFYEF